MKNDILKKTGNAMARVVAKGKKHSPEILIVAGVAGTVVSAVLACRATLKVGEVAEKAKDDVERIHKAAETGVTEAGEAYTAEDNKKDLTIVYVRTGLEYVKLYAPAAILGALSITGILASNSTISAPPTETMRLTPDRPDRSSLPSTAGEGLPAMAMVNSGIVTSITKSNEPVSA